MALTLSSSGTGGVFTLRGGSFGGRFQASVTPPGLLLDTYPGASLAFSLRKLRTAYTGNAIRVRRSSDNAEQNIGFVNDYLDTTAISTFCGAGNGFITTWYDQSGNANNASESSATKQPQIFFSGSFVLRSGKVYIQFTPGKTLRFLGLTRTPSQNYSFWITYEKSDAGNQAILLYDAGTYMWLDYGQTAQYINATFQVINLTPNNYLINTRYLVNHICDTSIVTAYSNGNAWGSVLTTSNTGVTILSFEARAAGTLTLNEFVYYSDSRAANRIPITTNINSFYSIY